MSRILDMRILQIDLARQKETIEYIKSYADFGKECGYNYFLLYLENAIRTPDTEFFNKEETYSIDEMKEIVNYIEGIGLKVIPCFENLPHLEKFFEYPQLAHLSELYDEKTPSRFGGSRYGSEGCPSNPELYKFLDKYVTDCMECFPNSEYIHMSLDEVFNLAHCDKCKARLANGETKADIFYEHTIKTYNLVKSLGRTMMMWDDFFEYVDISERLPRDIIMVNWNYSYIGSEPIGHWVGRRKRDWFRWYDKLGFKYIFGVYAHRGSSIFNTESFTRYADRFSPIGAICTSWERRDSFYHGSYPFVYYSAQKWLGKINCEQDKIDAIAHLLQDDKDLAKLLLSNDIGGLSSNWSMLDRVENATGGSGAWVRRTKYFLEQLESYLPKMTGLAKDILTDIYDYACENFICATFNEIGNKVFDAYETDGITDKFIPEIECAQTKLAKIYENAKGLWAKYRPNIKSRLNTFENKWNGYLERINKIKEGLKENKKWGTLTGEYMLHNAWGNPRMEIKVNYQDGTSEIVFSNQLKPMLGSACFQVRYKIQNKPIESLTLTGWGEGASYPSYFYYLVNDKKYIVDSVEKIQGNCERLENLLENDSGFAIMGYEDALKCFNDVECTKEKHIINVKFREL